MAIYYQVYMNEELLTLNQLDELLCEVQEVEVDKKEYCDLYNIITGAFIGMEMSGKNLFDELDESYANREWYRKDRDSLVNLFKSLTIKTWRK